MNEHEEEGRKRNEERRHTKWMMIMSDEYLRISKEAAMA
jgi:hypothetical protein